MKIAVLVARILLGLIFLFFGLNGFFNFLHAPLPPGGAGQFIPLALILLGPVLVNILLFHITLAPAGLPPGLFATLLWFIIFFGVRRAFAGVFAQKVEI